MKIHVKGYMTLKNLIGDRMIQVEETAGLTLGNLLLQLSAETGEDLTQGVMNSVNKAARARFAILVNGCHASHLPEHLDTPLKDGDEVSIFPPIAGG